MTNGAIILLPDESQTVTLHQCLKYIEKRPHGEYTNTDLQTILTSYFTYAQQVKIDTGIAVAQMFLETGNLISWWAARPRRNPCGYGVTGEQRTSAPLDTGWQIKHPGLWVRGYAFISWDIAARTHLAHLLCYTLKDKDMNEMQLEFSNFSPRKNLLPLSYRGCARTVFELSGKWASDIRYGENIMSMLGGIKIQR